MPSLTQTTVETAPEILPFTTLEGRTGRELRIGPQYAPLPQHRPIVDWNYVLHNPALEGVNQVTAAEAASYLGVYVGLDTARALLSDVKAVRDDADTKSLLLGVAPLHRYNRHPNIGAKTRTVTFQDPRSGMELVYNASLFTGSTGPEHVEYDSSILEEIVQSARGSDDRHDSAKIYVPPQSKRKPGMIVLQGGTIETPDKLRRSELPGSIDMDSFYALADAGLADGTGTGAKNAHRWAAGAQQPAIFASESRDYVVLFMPGHTGRAPTATPYVFQLRSYDAPHGGGLSVAVDPLSLRTTPTGNALGLVLGPPEAVNRVLPTYHTIAA